MPSARDSSYTVTTVGLRCPFSKLLIYCWRKPDTSASFILCKIFVLSDPQHVAAEQPAPGVPVPNDARVSGGLAICQHDTTALASEGGDACRDCRNRNNQHVALPEHGDSHLFHAGPLEFVCLSAAPDGSSTATACETLIVYENSADFDELAKNRLRQPTGPFMSLAYGIASPKFQNRH